MYTSFGPQGNLYVIDFISHATLNISKYGRFQKQTKWNEKSVVVPFQQNKNNFNFTKWITIIMSKHSKHDYKVIVAIIVNHIYDWP